MGALKPPQYFDKMKDLTFEKVVHLYDINTPEELAVELEKARSMRSRLKSIIYEARVALKN